MSVLPTTNKKWVLDPSHSELTFEARYPMITNVKGRFGKFDVEIDGEEFTTPHICVHIEASSISTHEEWRDTHLKSVDFLDVENHKEILFTGRR